jgi:hypothetical protein
MIFERRRYTAKPGKLADFVALQHARGFDGPSAGLMSRVIGYFVTVTGPVDQIVHLYRYDDHADWIDKLHGMYGIEALGFYFTGARAALAEQDTDFFQSSPIAALNPLWSDGNDWLPGPGKTLWDLAKQPDLVVEETEIWMRPGGLPVFWDATDRFGLEATAPLRNDTLATWFAMTGRLHRVLTYRVFPSIAERDAALTQAGESPAMASFEEAIEAATVSRTATLLRPVTVREMSPLFHL